MITTKEKIIEYFESGIKANKDFKIGIEHEKFLFNNKDNKRITYEKIKEMFQTLQEFGWKPVFEKTNFKEFLKEHYTIGYKSTIDEAALEGVLEGED